MIKHIRINEGTRCLYPTTGIIDSPVESVEMVKKEFGRQKVYAVGPNHHAVMYLTNKEAYCVPWTRELIAQLNELGYQRRDFYVPFDSGDIPLDKDDAREWRLLVAEALASYRDDFTEDCIRWSKRHGIGRLSSRLLENCLEVPERGLFVRNSWYDEKVSPMLNQYEPDPMASAYLGRYAINKGIVVFVYRDGRTFVGKGYGLVRKLDRAGYQETGMFVPFSNGALPVDRKLRERWLSLPNI